MLFGGHRQSGPQPAVTTNVSPAAIASGIACHNTSRATAPLRRFETSPMFAQ